MKGAPRPHTREHPAHDARVGGQQDERTQVTTTGLLAPGGAHELLGEDLAHELTRRHPPVNEGDNSEPPGLGTVHHNGSRRAEVNRRGTERIRHVVHPLPRLRRRTGHARHLAVRRVKHETDRQGRAHDQTRPPRRFERDKDDETERREAHGDETDEIRSPAESRARRSGHARSPTVHPTHVRGNTRAPASAQRPGPHDTS